MYKNNGKGRVTTKGCKKKGRVIHQMAYDLPLTWLSCTSSLELTPMGDFHLNQYDRENHLQSN